MVDHKDYVHPNNSIHFLSYDGGASYDLCHCKSFRFHPALGTDGRPDWSNFEIADMDFWRGEAYSKFFDHLESKGGFYYEVRHFLSIIVPISPVKITEMGGCTGA